MFLKYNGSTTYQYFYNTASALDVLTDYTLDNAFYKFAFSKNQEYFALGQTNLTWEVYHWT